jgi:hypothetical protein
MRKLVLLLAILALPGLALGQPQLDVGVGGAPGAVVAVPPLGPIVIDVLLTSGIPLDGAQYSLSAELVIGGVPMGPGSGDPLVMYDPVTPWINGTLFTGVGLDYVMLIGTGAGNGATMAMMNMSGPEMYFKGSGSIAPQPVPALLAQYVIHVAPLAPGDRLLITAGADPMGMFGNGYIINGGAGGGPWHPGVPLVITPEPASILLLLGALPFLRRRR